MNARYGPALAHANHFRVQESERERMTRDMFGPSSPVSSASASLQRALASRLRAKMDAAGSPEFSLTWKNWDMPSREPICALQAKARWPKSKPSTQPKNSRTSGRGRQQPCSIRDFLSGGRTEHWYIGGEAFSAPLISGNACGGWPTPVANDDNKSPDAHMAMKARMGGGRKTITSLQVVSQLAGWQTPSVADGTGGHLTRGNERGGELLLPGQALAAAGWATPTVRDHKDCGDLSGSMQRTDGTARTDKLAYQATVSGYPTPRATDNRDRGDWFSPAIQRRVRIGKQIELTMLTGAIGQTPSGSPAPTGKRGALNPRLSLWLMGYPEEWASCGERAMQSFPKSRRSSSAA